LQRHESGTTAGDTWVDVDQVSCRM
jgi:hypothetical protein